MTYIDEEGNVDADAEIPIDFSQIEEGSVGLVNDSGLDSETVLAALSEQHAEFAAVRKWVTSHTGHYSKRGRKGTIFDRDKYLAPRNTFDEMVTAYSAVRDDDVVSGAADLTESLAFNKMSIDAEDIEE